MTTVFVDLVNLDGSRPEGRLRFSLEQLRVGDPDVVPSSVEVVILDGKARVENLLPGEMKVLVSTGGWSKEWPVVIPDDGTHDLFDLLGVSAPEFEHALWASRLGRVEALEQVPAVDLAPLENRVTALEAKPSPEPFDPTALETQLAELQSRFEEVRERLNVVPSPQDYLPKELTADNNVLYESIDPLFEWGGQFSAYQRLNQVSIEVFCSLSEGMAEVFENALLIKGLPQLAYGSEFLFYSRCRVEFFKDNEVHYAPRAHDVCLKRDDEGVVLQDRDPRFGLESGDTFRKALEKGCDAFMLTVHYYTNL